MTAEQLCAKHCTLASCRKAVCVVFDQRAEGGDECAVTDDETAYVSESIRAQMQRMAIEIRDANAKLSAVKTACVRYGCCANGYDPGESCGCLLCEVAAALAGAGQDRDTAAACSACSDDGDLCGQCGGPGIRDTAAELAQYPPRPSVEELLAGTEFEGRGGR